MKINFIKHTNTHLPHLHIRHFCKLNFNPKINLMKMNAIIYFNWHLYSGETTLILTLVCKYQARAPDDHFNK
jgi:hypothetical protein